MKGQNLRLFVGEPAKCIAAAVEASFHIGTTSDDSSTKDSTGDWSEIEITGKSWDASASCQFQMTDSGATTAKDLITLIGTKVKVSFAPTSGDKNRTKGVDLLSGEAYITDLSIQSSNKQTVTASVTLTGSGPLS